MTARVLDAAERLAYRPNPLGRALRKQRSDIWSVLVPDIENPFFTAVVRGLEAVALANGKAVMLCNTNEDLEREAAHIRTVVEHQTSGVVVATASATQSNLGPLLDNGIPVVLIDRAAELHLEIDSVLADNEAGAYEATSHLLKRGHGLIGCVSGPSDVSTSQERVEGYKRALRDAHLDRTPNLVACGEFTPAGGKTTAQQLLAQVPRPDALFVTAARMAIGVIEAIRQAGLEVGADVGLVTFDDEPWTSLVTPPITVVRQPTYDLGALAARVLLDAQNGRNHGETHERLSCELIVRASSPWRS